MSHRITVSVVVLVALAGCSRYPGAASQGEAQAGITGGKAESAVAVSADVSEASAGSDIGFIAETYRSLRAMTPEPVYVNPEFAVLCVPVSRELVEEAREEHGVHAHSTIMIYMNALAAEALASDPPAYPQGAVIVKEKQRLHYRNADGTEVRDANGVGGMIKRGPDFDPEHGNWEYFYFEEPERIESGRIASCVTCHEGAKATDYVFGSWMNQE
jgi:hypothetical protein